MPYTLSLTIKWPAQARINNSGSRRRGYQSNRLNPVLEEGKTLDLVILDSKLPLPTKGEPQVTPNLHL